MKENNEKYVITLCYGPTCLSRGAVQIREALDNEIARRGLSERVRIALSGCLGLSDQGPILIVNPGFSVFGNVSANDIPELVEEHILNDRPLARLAIQADHLFNRFYRIFGDVNFFGKQMRITLRNCGIIDPESLDDYLSLRGYEALAKVLTSMSRQDVIDEVKKSGLRGRGGAGFPTGIKWDFAAKEQNDVKYVICNADEGDPGAFMDRSAIEGDPHTILEGMAIGGYAIGAVKGFIYIRAEYPLAIDRLEKAIADAKKEGFLGKNILGSDFSFDIEIRLGAGAFVCGEETALMHSIEGQRGIPTPKPPFPAVEGVFKKPTIINNVETWANIPVVILDGGEWFSSIGTETSKGTKVFALAGNVRNTGLVEVPMGTTLREIVYDIGGGIPNNKKFKSVQTGGPSGGCLPEQYLDTQIDYESLARAGSIMGSGGMIVVDENTCMVDMAKYFLEFTQDESCGKCTPCREGIGRMHEILLRITKGEGKLEDIEKLKYIGRLIKSAALCGLGQSAPNPVLSTLQYFEHEYIEHIVHKRCPAGVCSALTGAPCQSACPLGTEAWRYIAHVERGEYEKAYIALREPNPLPSVCARVCNHPCERSCRAGRGDGEAISIRNLKRFVTDRVDPSVFKPEKSILDEEEIKKVAVVGAGPAGLSAAHYLSLKGYKVTIFDAEEKPGGLLLKGIPSYRLPRDVLNRDIEFLMNENITFKGKTFFGTDITVKSLFDTGFNAVFIAIGSHQSLRLKIDGEDFEGVYPSMYFLRGHNLENKNLAKGNVGVIGGGNSAIDAARIAIRQEGVESVKIFYRRTRNEMPAIDEEIEAALEEGVKLETLISPERIVSENGRLKQVEFIRNILGESDKSGRRRPLPVIGSDHLVEIDTLIVAISEEPDKSAIAQDGLELTDWGTVKIDADTLATSIPGVFAGGDVVTGPNTVVDAIAAGKNAALTIERYLCGRDLRQTPQVNLPEIYIPQAIVDEEEETVEFHRPETPSVEVELRRKSFMEVEKSLSVENAEREARRCLRCDLEFTQKKI
ncbi:MAG: FAD-dependent oxidoreductase [Deltaproteobacteria bacterium]|nr:FAD-dependent oxidoreductase [Deltaproteobacteria bacterium]